MAFTIYDAFKSLDELSENDVELVSKRKKKISESIKNRKNEDVKFNLLDSDEVEEAKKFLEDDKEEDVERIVDVNADDVTKLKDSYIGDAILQCSVCRTLIYKELDKLVRDSDDNDLFNVGEECPHCGSVSGYYLVGQVSALDLTKEKEEVEVVDSEGKEEVEVKAEEETDEIDTDKIENDLNVDKNLTTVYGEEEEEVEESLNLNEKLKNLDEEKFDKLINKYLKSVYKNVDSYVSNEALIYDSNNKIDVNGTIKYKNGVEKNTTFKFECVRLKEDKIRFKGSNQKFSKSNKAFTLSGRLDNDNLISESLSYSYATKVNSEKLQIRGKVRNFLVK